MSSFRCFGRVWKFKTSLGCYTTGYTVVYPERVLYTPNYTAVYLAVYLLGNIFQRRYTLRYTVVYLAVYLSRP